LSTFGESFSAALQLIVAGDPVLLSIVWRSVTLSALATTLAFGFGTVLGAWLAVSKFAGRRLVVTLVNTLLSLPSVVVGLVVYLLLSRSGPLGFLGWLYSFKAMLLAQTVLVLPIVIALVRQVVEDAYTGHGEQLQSLGVGPRLSGLLLAFDERSAMLTIAMAVFGRAIAEVGAVMMVGGNMDGFTRVMTTTIALETSKGDLPLAMGLGLILLTVVLVLQVLLSAMREWLQAADAMKATAVLHRVQEPAP
jgi:tungstate transport system permease protein